MSKKKKAAAAPKRMCTRVIRLGRTGTSSQKALNDQQIPILKVRKR